MKIVGLAVWVLSTVLMSGCGDPVPEADTSVMPPEAVSVPVADVSATPATKTPAVETPAVETPAVETSSEGVVPDCPAAAGMDLDLTLVDYIDCTKVDETRAFLDQGTSSVAEGPAGKYRITASHRHAFFAYRIKAAGKDNPVLIVYEYPDDAERTINFSTHESGLSGRSNNDWSLETGVYTGGPFPLSNKMQYHTFIYWPQDEEPCVLVGNFHRTGHPAAASKIWVYAINGKLPKLEIDAPDPDNQRKLGHFNSFAFLPTAFHYGYRSKNAVEHMLDYCQYVGVNELSWCVVANNSWGAWCDVPSFPSTGDRGHLDRVLSAMDARGGMSFMACMGPEGNIKLDGESYADMSPQRLKEAVCKFFSEFLEKYGKYESLKGIGLGSQYGIHFYHKLSEAGIVQDVVSHIKSIRPDMQVMVFAGGYGLHKEYFAGETVHDVKAPTPLDVLNSFQSGQKSWMESLGDAAIGAWRVWGQDPADMKKVEGLDVFEQYQPDDFGIFGLYANQPRSMMYFDLDNSDTRSDYINSPFAAMWNTHYEGWWGLHPEVNFWYQKLWVAPDFTAPEPLSLASFARIMGHHDRLNILPGSWNNKYFGHEARMRKFAKAYRSLPPVVMQDLEDDAFDWVKVRQIEYNGILYVSVQNLIPYALGATVNGQTLVLEPYDLAVFTDKPGNVTVAVEQPLEYVNSLMERFLKGEALYRELLQLNKIAANPAFQKATDTASRLLAENKFYQADMTFTVGMLSELQLRRDVLDPPEMAAARLYRPFEFSGDLDAWPKAATDLSFDSGDMLAGHLYFPNSWDGPQDLSARLRFTNDRKVLYIGGEITDDKLLDVDNCQIRLSTDGAFLDPISLQRKCNIAWDIAIPTEIGQSVSGHGAGGFTYTATRTQSGLVFEGKAALADLKVSSGGFLGFVLHYNDRDGLPNRKNAGWAAQQAMLIPNDVNFQYWDDARACGRLVLKP